jgi:hypothetical protein
MQTIIERTLIAETELTASGEATPAVIGNWLQLGSMTSPLSLFLVNDGDSISLSVTYQVGFIDVGDKFPSITAVTPGDGGVVSALTAVNIAGSKQHASISLAPGKYYRFIITNGDAVNGAASVALFGHHAF